MDVPPARRFTGIERDPESGGGGNIGLDHADFRQYSSQFGRWMTIDPDNAGASLENPQSWNAYSYVVNNPLVAIDPDGLDCVYTADADGNPNPGSLTVVTGDCLNKGGKDDGGTFVDNDENHPVQKSDVTINDDGSVGIVAYRNANGVTTSYACVGDCPTNNDSVNVRGTDPGPIPTIWIGPEHNWLFTKQGGCVWPGFKGFLGGLVMKKTIDSVMSPILGPSEMDGPAALGTGTVAGHIGLDSVAKNRPLLNATKAALKEEGHKVSANTLAKGAKFGGKLMMFAHAGIAAYEGWEDYHNCSTN